MKKIFLIAAVVVLAAVGANAQEKGKFWVGGNVSFGSAESSTTVSTNSFNVQPEFGINFSDRWAAGIRLGFGQTKMKIAAEVNKIQAFNIAPFARYTFLNWKALSLFADGGFNYESVDGTIDGDTYSGNTVCYGGLFVNPGFSVYLSNRFALTGSTNVFSAGYSELSPEVNSWAASLNSPFNLDNFTLGFSLTF